MKQITIDVLPDGTVSIEAAGFRGNACEKATKAIEEALGGKVQQRKKKPEFWQQNVGSQHVGQ